MGEYWVFVCVNRTTGEILMHLNPQSGFGGMKWKEFIGTAKGTWLLDLLKDMFCPPAAVWAVVSDYGGARYFPEGFNFELLRDDASERACDTHCIGFHPTLRRMAMDLGLTDKKLLELGDLVAMDKKELVERTGGNGRHLTPPDLEKMGLCPESDETHTKKRGLVEMAVADGLAGKLLHKRVKMESRPPTNYVGLTREEAAARDASFAQAVGENEPA